MTHHLVDTGTHTHGEALIVETSRDSVVLFAIGTTNLVNLEGIHASVNLGSHSIQHASINHASATNALYLLGSLDEIGSGNQLALTLPIHNFFIKFSRLLSWLTVPSAFFCHILYLIVGAKVLQNDVNAKF